MTALGVLGAFRAVDGRRRRDFYPGAASLPVRCVCYIPLCDAHASAISLCDKDSASAAPLSTSGSAWSGFTADRGKTGTSIRQSS